MNIEAMAEYLTSRGWIYVSLQPEGKRWLNPKNMMRMGVKSAYKWQLDLDNNTIRVFKCQGCGKTYDTRLDTQTHCSFCRVKAAKNKNRKELASTINVSESLIKEIKAAADRKNKTIREIAEYVLRAGLKIMEAEG